jgi:alpha/beta superfamily hydrolase
MEQDKVTKLSSQKNVWDEDSDRRNTMTQDKKKVSWGQRWHEAQPTKMVVFWACIASIILTMIVGFSWGGWVTAGTAEEMAKDAVVQRLAPICVGQMYQDPGKEQKLIELSEARTYQRDDYVKAQGWATMIDEENADSKVADACAKLLAEINP